VRHSARCVNRSEHISAVRAHRSQLSNVFEHNEAKMATSIKVGDPHAMGSDFLNLDQDFEEVVARMVAIVKSGLRSARSDSSEAAAANHLILSAEEQRQIAGLQTELRALAVKRNAAVLGHVPAVFFVNDARGLPDFAERTLMAPPEDANSGNGLRDELTDEDWSIAKEAALMAASQGLANPHEHLRSIREKIEAAMRTIGRDSANRGSGI
jgi:hypothetical protein